MQSRERSDLELVLSNYLRTNYENKYDERYIPISLKYIMVKYSNSLIPSNLLSLREDFNFFETLKLKLPNIKKFNLLYRGSEHNFSAKDFHSLCDDKGATLTIIASNHGNIFGGYTSKSWKSAAGFVKDKQAFLFLIKSHTEKINKQCPLFFDIKKGHESWAIGRRWSYSDPICGPVFGCALDIKIGDKQDYDIDCFTQRDCYDYGNFEGNLSGNDGGIFVRFEVTDYEVFQVS